MLIAGAIGAVGNVIGTAITGVDTIWNVTVAEFGYIILANMLGMAGRLHARRADPQLRRRDRRLLRLQPRCCRRSPTVLAETQEWFADKQPWVDFNYAQGALFDGVMTGEQWAQLGVTGLFWLVIPLTIGLWSVLRSEVK